MKLYIGNVLEIHNPTEELVKWCKTNLTLANPDYVKKQRMGFWVGDTPKNLNLYETRESGNVLVLPFGVLRDVGEFCNNCEIYTTFKEPVSVDYGNPIPLYDYQEKAVREVLNARYGILQSPAGSGKTQMGISLIREYGKRALWLTHTIDLLKQSKSRAEQYMSEDLMGTITEGKVDVGKGITFATVQTMCKLDLTPYKDYWDVIIVDECHRTAGSPTTVTQFYKVLNSLSARHKHGLSATVHRADGMIKATYSLLGKVVYAVPESEVADKIMKVGIKPYFTRVKISRECQNTDGTINYTSLINYLGEHPVRNEIITSCIVNEAEHSCLILSDRLSHLETLMKQLPQDLRAKAVMISGKMTTKKGKAEREQAIEDMRKGIKKYLFATYSLAKEGLDIPCLDRLFLATPQKDFAVITQSIGRIARTCENKSEPVCYDFVDDIQYLVRAYKKRCSTYKKNHCYFTEG